MSTFTRYAGAGRAHLAIAPNGTTGDTIMVTGWGPLEAAPAKVALTMTTGSNSFTFIMNLSPDQARDLAHELLQAADATGEV